MHPFDTSPARRASLVVACLGIASHAGAVLVATSRIEGYVAASHPVAVLGARGIPGAPLFNAFAFVLPGLCAATCAWRLRKAVGAAAAWPARIGAHMLLLAGLAFAAQGLWPLDLDELDGGRSRGHATVWMSWAVAAVAGGVATALGLAMQRDWARALACSVLTLCVLGATGGLLPLDAGFAQRVGACAWAVCVVMLTSIGGHAEASDSPRIT